MWGVKLHTANGDSSDGAGSDDKVKIKFQIIEEYDGPNGEKEFKEIFSCTTKWLDKEGDDRERGNSDKYTADRLGKYWCSLTIENYHQF